MNVAAILSHLSTPLLAFVVVGLAVSVVLWLIEYRDAKREMDAANTPENARLRERVNAARRNEP